MQILSQFKYSSSLSITSQFPLGKEEKEEKGSQPKCMQKNGKSEGKPRSHQGAFLLATKT